MENYWFEAAGLFMFLAGFVVGLGAVTVIDLHGLLSLRSVYWTTATIRSHKITKPLIWLGIFLVILGGSIFYSQHDYSEIMVFHALLAVILILNGCFLSFYISPLLIAKEKKEKDHITLLPDSMQRKIAVSFVISFCGWWGSLGLLVIYLVGR